MTEEKSKTLTLRSLRSLLPLPEGEGKTSPLPLGEGWVRVFLPYSEQAIRRYQHLAVAAAGLGADERFADVFDFVDVIDGGVERA